MPRFVSGGTFTTCLRLKNSLSQSNCNVRLTLCHSTLSSRWCASETPSEARKRARCASRCANAAVLDASCCGQSRSCALRWNQTNAVETIERTVDDLSKIAFIIDERLGISDVINSGACATRDAFHELLVTDPHVRCEPSRRANGSTRTWNE